MRAFTPCTGMGKDARRPGTSFEKCRSELSQDNVIQKSGQQKARHPPLCSLNWANLQDQATTGGDIQAQQGHAAGACPSIWIYPPEGCRGGCLSPRTLHRWHRGRRSTNGGDSVCSPPAATEQLPSCRFPAALAETRTSAGPAVEGEDDLDRKIKP